MRFVLHNYIIEYGSVSDIQVRIDQIKELQLDDIQSVYSEGEYWLLSKRNELEAVVERYIDIFVHFMRLVAVVESYALYFYCSQSLRPSRTAIRYMYTLYQA